MRKVFVFIQCELPTIQSFGWSTLSGTIGTLILAGFFSGVMSLETLDMLIPLIVGVNAAVSGYMLIERGEDEIKRKKTMSAAVGMMVALLSFILVNTLCFQMGGFILISGFQALVATIIGIVGGWSGGVLAVKYKELKEKVPAL